MLYPSLQRYRHLKCPGFKHINSVCRLYGELPSNAIGSIVWVEGRNEARLGVLIATTYNRKKAMVMGKDWYCFVPHDRIWFLGPKMLRSWAADQFRQAKLPAATG